MLGTVTVTEAVCVVPDVDVHVAVNVVVCVSIPIQPLQDGRLVLCPVPYAPPDMRQLDMPLVESESVALPPGETVATDDVSETGVVVIGAMEMVYEST